MTLKISISGVRGIVGQTLTDDVVTDFARAFASYLKRGTVVIGRDSRASGQHISSIFIDTLRSLGISVIDIGLAPTPTVQLMVKHLKADGGVILTASHNPVEWNGIKFVRSDGIFLNEDQAGKLIHIYDTKAFKDTAGDRGSIRKIDNSYDVHINRILDVIDAGSIKKRNFKVVLDSCNGAGSIITVQLLERLGCSVIGLYTDPNKPFPHNPEPIPSNLKDLCGRVVKERADLGLAQDADADRLAIVTEAGIAPGEEYTMAIAVQNVLSKAKAGKKFVVTNLSTSMMSDDIARRFDAKVLRTKIGEVNVAERMKKEKGLIGGEGNGGVMYPQVGYNRDSLAGIGLLLDSMAGSGKKISELISELPKYEIVKKKMDCASSNEVSDMLDKIKKAYKGTKMDITDGIKLIYPEAWVHVRASNTEPVIRVIAEAKSLKEAEALTSRILDL